ncbi:hypothetical protein HN51_023211 [Arachis hypogaea]
MRSIISKLVLIIFVTVTLDHHVVECRTLNTLNKYNISEFTISDFITASETQSSSQYSHFTVFRFQSSSQFSEFIKVSQLSLRARKEPSGFNAESSGDGEWESGRQTATPTRVVMELTSRRSSLCDGAHCRVAVCAGEIVMGDGVLSFSLKSEP